jgi:hypothetical protein
MIGKITLFTVIIFMVIIFILMDSLRFLSMYKMVIYKQYTIYIALYSTLLFVNIFGVLFIIYRKFFLKDTGKKLDLLMSDITTQDDELPTDFEEWSK